MAPPADPPSSITLRIKVPPGQIPGGADEFTLGSDIPVSSKVGRVREQIQETIPSSPTPERQRLLYAGRALIDNDQSLADALNIRRDPTQTEYVVHLLIKGDGTGTAPVPHRRGVNTPTRSASPATAPPQSIGAGQPQVQTNAAPQILPQAQHPYHLPPAVQHGLMNPTHPTRMVQAPGFPPNGAFMPFGMQPPNFAGQMPMAGWAQQQALQQAAAMQHHQQHQAALAGTQPPNASQQPNVLPNQPPQPQPPSQLQPQAEAQTQHPQGGGEAPAQPQQQQQGAPNPSHRPLSGQGMHIEGIGPNGQRFTIHQQTLNFPHVAVPGQQMPMQPPGQMPHVPFGLPPLPGTSPQNQAGANRPTALDQARANIAEMHRMLEELRRTNADEPTSEAQRTRIAQLEERTQALNDYIDPLRYLGSTSSNRARSNSPQAQAPMQNAQVNPPSRTHTPTSLHWPQQAQQARLMQQQPMNSNSTDVTCYLLSSPTGPQAILYSPQHGTFTGSVAQQHANAPGLRPTPTTTAANDPAAVTTAQAQQNPPAAQDQGDANAPAQQQAPAAQPDPLGPLAPLLGHFWLLLRVLIFSYFLLGANMGWRRPLALMAIGLGFWLIRAGLLGDGGALRRWWDGIVNEGRPPRPVAQGGAQAQQQGQQAQNQAGEQQQNQQPGSASAANHGHARPGQMPTPEQVAQRLLDEDARRQEAARGERMQWLRERVRPIERAVALLVASLWPGVGEAYVRAREQEERRRAEEEIAARRQEEEERAKQEEEKKAAAEEGTEGEAKAGGVDAPSGPAGEVNVSQDNTGTEGGNTAAQ